MTFLTMRQKTWHCVTIPVCDFDFEQLHRSSLFFKRMSTIVLSVFQMCGRGTSAVFKGDVYVVWGGVVWG